jgi:hypothetical protein
MSFPPALLQWLHNCHPQLAAEASAAPAAPAKAGKAASNPLLSFLNEWYTAKRLTVTEGGRIHFIATSHDCKCDWPTIEAYINGKAYKKAVAKNAAAPFDITPFRAFFGEHKRDPTKVYCHLTDLMLNKDADELKRHMEGERFITARLARAKKMARRAERAKARAINSAAALAEEDEDEDDDEGLGNPYEGAQGSDDDEEEKAAADDDDDEEEEEVKSAKPFGKMGKGAFAAAPKGKPAAKPATKPAVKPAAAAPKAAAANPAAKATAAPATGAAALGAALFASLGKAGVSVKPAAAAAGKGGLKRSADAAAAVKRSKK